jgi:hypothetical protein
MISRISAQRENTLIADRRTTMTTLTESPLAPLLDRLFNEADVASADIAAVFADLSDDDQDRLIRGKTGYRDLYGRLKNAALAVSPETGTLLEGSARPRQSDRRRSDRPRRNSRGRRTGDAERRSSADD